MKIKPLIVFADVYYYEMQYRKQRNPFFTSYLQKDTVSSYIIYIQYTILFSLKLTFVPVSIYYKSFSSRNIKRKTK